MSSLRRIAITGSSGSYGRGLIAALRSQIPDVHILGLDVVEPNEDRPDEFIQCDITSSDLVEHLKSYKPDTCVHLAFVVNPMHDKQRMRHINVDGSRNFFAAAAEVGPERVLVSSSATAYGAWPDNPPLITEDQPVKARPEYQYAQEKVLVEEMLEEFAKDHPNVTVSWTRPALIYGKGTKNVLIDMLTKVQFVTMPDGVNSHLQLVHLDDVADATVKILTSNGSGPYNIAPPNWITLKGLSRLKRRPRLSLPLWFCKGFMELWWKCRLPWFLVPSSLIYFIRYPWQVDPKRLTEELEFEFQYTSEEVMIQVLKDTGWWKEPKQANGKPSDAPESTTVDPDDHRGAVAQ